jgi:hypothetical protein
LATPQEKLANALEALHGLQKAGRHAIRSDALKQTDCALLVCNGFPQPVIKGWYIATRPDPGAGESTAWYASNWDFARDHLKRGSLQATGVNRPEVQPLPRSQAMKRLKNRPPEAAPILRAWRPLPR